MAILGFLILCIVGVIVYQLILLASPTKGKPIGLYENPNKALLVIDVQEDFTGAAAKLPYKDSERMISVVNAVIQEASSNNIIIVHAYNAFESFISRIISRMLFKGSAIKGAPGSRIDERILTNSSDLYFSKQRADAFSNPDLEKDLEARGVSELYLVGLDAAGCVDRTAKGALNRGYQVTIITDGVITQYEKKWDNLLKKWAQQGIQVMSSQEFISGGEKNR